MGSLFRSEEMTLCQLFLQAEAAYACVSELGELGLVQFRDLNPDVNAFQRKFVNEVRRCDEMERKLRFLEKEIRKDGIPMLDTGDNPEAPVPREMIDLEATFEKLEGEMNEVNSNSEALKRNFLELTELKHILRKTQTFFDEAEHHHIQAMHEPGLTDETVGLLGDDQHPKGQALKLGFVAGVILRERIPAFERMLWRVCRGNVFLKQAEIDTPLEDPVTGDQVYKSVFIIFFQGEQLKTRVKKISEGFRATLYPCPETQQERREMAIGVMTRIEDLNTVLGQTQDHRHRVLVAAAKNIKVWFIKVRKIKAIYYMLNMFNLDVTQKCLIAECWCPVGDLDRIQQALQRGNERSGSSVPSILNRMNTKQEPPTYNRTNKFTAVFQNIVDAYGVASYREVNPAPFTIISFPFLFAVMFGDIGHGFIMFLAALYLVLREKHYMAKKVDDEIFGMFFDGRYIILLMGIFSMYTGLVYNDIFSKSLNLFGSSWSPNHQMYDYHKMDLANYKICANASCFSGAYPFGIDPVWQMSINKITITNSIKMKMSVIFGVSQMLFGLVLSLINHRFFRRPLNIYVMFIPQLIFILSIFGYLILLIFIKWLKFTEKDSQTAPNLLIGLINMFLMTYPEKGKGSDSLQPFYAGQQAFQTTLVILALLCVVVLFVAKPYLLYRQNKYGQKKNEYRLLNGGATNNIDLPEIVHHDDDDRLIDAEDDGEEELSVNSGDLINPDTEILHHGDGEMGGAPAIIPEEPFNLSEVIIDNAIHTIEYCLGCISHTASYLRLWALSLAHGQLSEVLWNMVMRIGFSVDATFGTIMIFCLFSMWAVLTVLVLVLMEGMSAFLHAIRLHWVEFQSKFYKGDGELFHPFFFETLLQDYSVEEPTRKRP